MFVALVLGIFAGEGLLKNHQTMSPLQEDSWSATETAIQERFLASRMTGHVGLHLTDEKGKRRIGISINPQGSGYGLVVYDDRDRLRAFLGLDRAAHFLSFFDDRDVPRLTIGHRPSPTFSGVWVRDSRGIQRFVLGEGITQKDRPATAAGLFLLDEKPQPQLAMYADSKGVPVLQFADAEQRQRIRLGFSGDGKKSTFSMHGKGGTARVRFEVGDDDSLTMEPNREVRAVTESGK